LSLTNAGGQPGVIFSGIADLCLDDERGATATGTHVEIYTCNGGTTQDWTAEPDGTIRFDSSYCMADSGTVTTGGHLIDLAPCANTSPAMQWLPRSDGSLYNPATGWCLTDPGASTSKLTTANLCISDAGAGTANGTKIQIWQCIADAAENDWTVEPDGTLRIFGSCLVPQNAGTADGTLIVLWSCEGEASQFWTERSDGTFVNKTSGTDLVDPNSSTTNGTQLTLLHYNTSPAEEWTPHGET
jgi:beta-glucosidase